MSKENLMTIKVGLLKVVAAFGLLQFVFLLFNVISTDDMGVSGIHLSGRMMTLMADGGLSISPLVILLSTSVLPLVILVLSILSIVKPKKVFLSVLAWVYLGQMIALFMSLLQMKTVLDGIQLIESGFLIRDLTLIYWLLMVVTLIGLIMVLKSIYVSTGYVVLTLMSVIWLTPILWIVLNSFRGEGGFYVSYFWPKTFSFDNYVKVITDTSHFQFAKWYGNTFIVSVLSCIITTCLVLSTSYVISRIQFKARKTLMNLLLILGMFPGFMAMIAIYYIIKGIGLTQSLAALVIVYSAGAAMGYYISKGFFDTIPKEIDEAASIDGATKWTVFIKIVIPLSKSIIIYTILTSFMMPWADYIFSSIILGDNQSNYTVAIGLYNMLTRENIEEWYKSFTAGALLIALPISFLFLSLQRYYVEGLSGSVKG